MATADHEIQKLIRENEGDLRHLVASQPCPDTWNLLRDLEAVKTEYDAIRKQERRETRRTLKKERRRQMKRRLKRRLIAAVRQEAVGDVLGLLRDLQV